ncbi:MAG TPA: hypothetical protein VFI63_00355 [Solirubrobacterales bacterium]|nr:hypothetical protein [Solirubrobacterales bacterium]
MSRGFGVAAGLDPGVARPLAERCAALGYESIWSNDHPGAKGLETLAEFAAAAPALDLGVAVIALDRTPPEAIAADVERLGLDPARLWLGVGAGFAERPLTRMREALPELRERLPGVRLVLAAMGPKMCALAGSGFDGAFFNWMTPEFAARSREFVEAGSRRRVRAGTASAANQVEGGAPWAAGQIEGGAAGGDNEEVGTGAAADTHDQAETGARAAGRETPPIFGYVRTAVGPDAAARLAKEESFYRDLHDGYRNHFARLAEPEGTVGVAAADADAAQKSLAAYTALDTVVVRGLASATIEAMTALATATAP